MYIQIIIFMYQNKGKISSKEKHWSYIRTDKIQHPTCTYENKRYVGPNCQCIIQCV